MFSRFLAVSALFLFSACGPSQTPSAFQMTDEPVKPVLVFKTPERVCGEALPSQETGSLPTLTTLKNTYKLSAITTEASALLNNPFPAGSTVCVLATRLIQNTLTFDVIHAQIVRGGISISNQRF